MDFIEAGLANLQIPGVTIKDLPPDVERKITKFVDEDTLHMRLNPVQMNTIQNEMTNLITELEEDEERYDNLNRNFLTATNEEKAWMRNFEKRMGIQRVNRF